MSTVAKIIELTSSSSKSIEDAVETGIQRADQTLDNIESAWVQDIKCMVKNGKVSEWRVNMKITFLLKWRSVHKQLNTEGRCLLA